MKKLLTTLAVLTAIATPAFAQSFDPDAGTGNVLPFRHEPTTTQNERLADHHYGLDARAMVPCSYSVRKPSGRTSHSRTPNEGRDEVFPR